VPHLAAHRFRSSETARTLPHLIESTNTMNTLSAAFVLAITAGASAGVPTTFMDATLDTFTPENPNLDIVSVDVSNNATHMTITVETLGYANWTKYLFFFNTGAPDQTATNAWNRPMNMNGNTIDRFMGSWVDQPANNAQLWTYGANWALDSTISNDQSDTGNDRVSWTFELAWLGLGVGEVLLFDVGTSGGGDFDTTVDLLSRDTQATDWWTNAATAGNYRAYTIVPTPGVLALAGLAGAISRRRRAA